MTIAEFIKELQCFDDDLNVGFMNEDSGGYIDSIYTVTTKDVTTFDDGSMEMVVIHGGKQIGTADDEY